MVRLYGRAFHKFSQSTFDRYELSVLRYRVLHWYYASLHKILRMNDFLVNLLTGFTQSKLHLKFYIYLLVYYCSDLPWLPRMCLCCLRKFYEYVWKTKKTFLTYWLDYDEAGRLPVRCPVQFFCSSSAAVPVIDKAGHASRSCAITWTTFSHSPWLNAQSHRNLASQKTFPKSVSPGICAAARTWRVVACPSPYESTAFSADTSCFRGMVRNET